MKPEDREFREAIECFKVIDTCLRCYYAGDSHMYRPLSAQLRILLSDKNRDKENSLVIRLFNGFGITPLQSITYKEPGTFDEATQWANMLQVQGGSPEMSLKLALMPFEITVFSNGLEIGDFLLDQSRSPIPVTKWMDQLITAHPIRLSIRELIKTVADRGGGAHVHHKEDQVLEILSKCSPSKHGMDVLFTIAVARITQQVGLAITQLYDEHGAEFDIENVVWNIDKSHERYKNAAKVPEVLFQENCTKYGLMSLGNVEENTTVA
jgi:hypothetical protein